MTMTRLLELNADEIMCLSDRVLNQDAGTEDQRVNSYGLLLKLGSAFVELVGSGEKRAGTVPIAVTESEAWLIRSKITTNDKTAADPLFGVKLLTKLYTALLGFNSIDEFEITAAEAGAMTPEQRQALAQWQELNSRQALDPSADSSAQPQADKTTESSERVIEPRNEKTPEKTKEEE